MGSCTTKRCIFRCHCVFVLDPQSHLRLPILCMCSHRGSNSAPCNSAVCECLPSSVQLCVDATAAATTGPSTKSATGGSARHILAKAVLLRVNSCRRSLWLPRRRLFIGQRFSARQPSIMAWSVSLAMVGASWTANRQGLMLQGFGELSRGLDGFQ